MPVLNDAALEAKWVEALRSGKYAQTQKSLRDSNGFCCLGVLCEVLKLPSKSQYKNDKGVDIFAYSFGTYTYKDEKGVEHEEQVLQDDIIAEHFAADIGLSYPMMDDLATMNDADNKTFAEIADWIEEQRNASK